MSRSCIVSGMFRGALSLFLSLPLGLALAACGDDSNPGGGTADTDTDASSSGDPSGDPTTDEPTTGTPTTGEPTTDASSTTDPTVDPDSSSEGTDTSDTTGTEVGDGDYRLNSIAVLDPPIALGPVSANEIASNLLTESLTTDDDADGNLDLSFVLQFRPLDQTDGASEAFAFANALCSAPQETASCDLLSDTMLQETTYTSSSGQCYAADPGNLSGAMIPATEGPCFLAESDSITIRAGLFDLPLENVRVAATYVGDPAGNLVSGNIEGLVTTASADEVVVEVEGLYDGPLSGLLSEEDQDGGGWVFHLSFTAVPTEWIGM